MSLQYRSFPGCCCDAFPRSDNTSHFVRIRTLRPWDGRTTSPAGFMGTDDDGGKDRGHTQQEQENAFTQKCGDLSTGNLQDSLYKSSSPSSRSFRHSGRSLKWCVSGVWNEESGTTRGHSETTCERSSYFPIFDIKRFETLVKGWNSEILIAMTVKWVHQGLGMPDRQVIGKLPKLAIKWTRRSLSDCEYQTSNWSANVKEREMTTHTIYT